ncbi:hypothetical protein C8J56DRAFT_721731, partial [Mycena floridula]
SFPPRPPSRILMHQIVTNFCDELKPDAFAEAGCAICGQLHRLKDLVPLKSADVDLNILCHDEVMCKERKNLEDLLHDACSPALASDCSDICLQCLASMKKDIVPAMALANGLWIGDVSPELQNLTVMEKLLIARVRHSYCVIKVASSWQYKMTANVICFSNP